MTLSIAHVWQGFVNTVYKWALQENIAEMYQILKKIGKCTLPKFEAYEPKCYLKSKIHKIKEN